MRIPTTACSVVMGGIPLRADAERPSAASSRPRTMVAARAALLLCSATVSALDTLAKSFACLAFPALMSSIEIDAVCWPDATDLMRPAIPMCDCAMWWAMMPTDHFSPCATFFQSASLSFSNTAVASCAFDSNCFASASPLAPMLFPPLSAQYTPLHQRIRQEAASHDRAHRHQLRHGRELWTLDARRRRRGHAEHHLREHRVRFS